MSLNTRASSLRFLSSVTQKVILCSLVSLTACATTHQARSVSPSGFLRDSAQLKQGDDDQALLTYRNPQANWPSYSKIIIAPVQIYAVKDADMNSDSLDEKVTLAKYFTASLNEKLKQHFTVVRTAGPGVLELRVALTDADQSEVLLNTISTVMPIGLALSTMKRAVTGKDTGVGFAQAEMEILDSQSSVRLAAAVDKRYGTKALRSKFGSWNDAQEAMDYWAEEITTKLVDAGAGHK